MLAILCVALFAFNAHHRPAPEFIPPVPGTLSVDVSRIAVTPLADAFAQTAASVEDAQSQGSTQDANSPTADAAPLPLQVATAVALNPSARVVLQAKDSVWLEIRDPSGHAILSRILKPGDAYDVPDQMGLKLDVGNAGAIAILVDGQPAPPLGQVGDVRRGVLLDPDALKSGGVNPVSAAAPATKTAHKPHVKKPGGDAFTGANDHYSPNREGGGRTPYYNE